MLDTPGHRCPLCGHALDADEVISDDASPYAAAHRCGYWGMTRWVLTAGSLRLGYLARMRRSRASSQYALLSMLLLAAGSALVVLPDYGWKHVMARDPYSPPSLPEPAGSGWWLVAQSPVPDSDPGYAVLVRLWWNPGLWVSALLIVPLVSFLLGYLCLALVRVGANCALQPAQRDQDRFGAAIHYSMAHVSILLLAAMCYGARIVQTFSQVQRWPLRWSRTVHLLPAFLLAGLGLFLMWFWLIRVAQAAPAGSRGRVARHFGLWAPLLAVVLIGGWLVAARDCVLWAAREAGMAF